MASRHALVSPPARDGVRVGPSLHRFMRGAVGRSALAAAAGLTFAATGATDVTSAGCSVQPGSNVGCEFYAVSLPNLLLDQALFKFGLVVTNAGAAPMVALHVCRPTTFSAAATPDEFAHG